MSVVAEPAPFDVRLGESPTCGAVLLGDVGGVDGGVEELAGRLLARRVAVAVVDLGAQAGSRLDEDDGADLEAALDAVDDGLCVDRAAAARAALTGVGPVMVVGFGLGGTCALMAAGALPGFTGVVAVGARLVYPTLTANKPVQPLDLLYGLSCPVQLHYGAEDRLVAPRHVDELRDRLDRRGVVHQLLPYEGRGSRFWDPRRPTWDAGAARALTTRIERFVAACNKPTAAA